MKIYEIGVLGNRWKFQGAFSRIRHQIGQTKNFHLVCEAVCAVPGCVPVAGGSKVQVLISGSGLRPDGFQDLDDGRTVAKRLNVPSCLRQLCPSILF